MTLIWTKTSFSEKIEQLVGQQVDIKIQQLFLCSFSRLRWVEVRGVKTIDFV